MQLRVHDCLVDTDTRQVLRREQAISLSPKAFQLLAILIENRPRVVSKDALHQALWPSTFVVDANLSNLIGEIRAALHDSARDPRFIRTVHGYGYAFSGEPANPPHAGRAAFSLSFGTERFPLHPGENLIGRAPDADICLPVTGVSRRHARIIVSGTEAFVEDIGSKNGTFVGGERIIGKRRLEPDDEVSFGTAHLRLDVIDPGQPTETISG